MKPELHDRWLRVTFGERGHGDFHLRWLRHNCDQDLHPLTRERTVCSSELPDDLAASDAWLDSDMLLVKWKHDGRVSRYPLGWLEEHAYARGRSATAMPNDIAQLELPNALEEHGAIILRDAGSDTEVLIDAFSARGLKVVGTHFGRIEDLRTDNTTNQNTDQLGYTDAPIDLHTDQPFLESPPRYQLLHCMRPADEGGDSTLVDAFAAAAVLREEDAAAYALLRTIPVRFHRKQKDFEKVLESPILTDQQVRYSYFTLAPYRLPFDQMEAWYRAHDRFARLVRDPKNQLRFSLRAGDAVLYDNHRMLHARTAFRGARWLRGVYFTA